MQTKTEICKMHKFKQIKNTMIMKQLIYKNRDLIHFLALFCVFMVSFAYFLQFGGFAFTCVLADFEGNTITQDNDKIVSIDDYCPHDYIASVDKYYLSDIAKNEDNSVSDVVLNVNNQPANVSVADDSEIGVNNSENNFIVTYTGNGAADIIKSISDGAAGDISVCDGGAYDKGAIVSSITDNIINCDTDCGFNVRVTCGDESKNIGFNLSVRKGARKYICDEGGVNLDKLAAFLGECTRRLIMPEYVLKFVFENFDEFVVAIDNAFKIETQNAALVTQNNSGSCFLKNAKPGVQIDKNVQILNIFYSLAQKCVKFSACKSVIKPSIEDAEFSNCTNLRGGFYTTYASSTAERKSNIELALSQFDGLVLGAGEVLSFNETTGRRTPENGYKSAKIITNGNFVEGNGGGVCQASTTLYNAALVAGLDIVEANQHSLKVGYVAPSFDAMVNFGSSDLKIKNNTRRPVMFATKCDGNTCRVNVFGVNNPYKIVRKSEVVSEIEPLPDKFVNAKDVPELENTQIEKSYYLHYPKKGLKSEGFLEYWQEGNLVATKKIRTNTYAPVTGVVVLANTDHNLPTESDYGNENSYVDEVFDTPNVEVNGVLMTPNVEVNGVLMTPNVEVNGVLMTQNAGI